MRSLLLRLNAWGFLTLIVLIPFSTGYVWRQPVAVSYLTIWSAIVIVLTLLNLLLGSLRLEKIANRSLVVAIGLFVVMLIWGSLFSEPLRSALGPWTNRFLQPLAVAYCGYLLLRQGQLTLKLLAGALGLSLAAVTLYGGLQATGLIDSHNINRVTGPFAFPNTFARVIEILLLALAPFLLLVKTSGRWLLGLTWLAGLAVLLATESYAGVGSLLFGLCVIVILLPGRFQPLKTTTLISLIIVVAAGFLLREQLPKYQATIGSSLATRQQFWHVAWETVKLNPLTGIGLEGWENQYLGLARHFLVNLQGEVIIETVSAQPHNVYLDALLRAGFIGLVAIGFFLLWPLRFALKQIRQFGETSWLVYAGAGLSIALLVFGLVDDPIFADEAMMMVLILYLAIASATKSASDS